MQTFPKILLNALLDTQGDVKISSKRDTYVLEQSALVFTVYIQKIFKPIYWYKTNLWKASTLQVSAWTKNIDIWPIDVFFMVLRFITLSIYLVLKVE